MILKIQNHIANPIYIERKTCYNNSTIIEFNLQEHLIWVLLFIHSET